MNLLVRIARSCRTVRARSGRSGGVSRRRRHLHRPRVTHLWGRPTPQQPDRPTPRPILQGRSLRWDAGPRLAPRPSTCRRGSFVGLEIGHRHGLARNRVHCHHGDWRCHRARQV